MQSSPHFAARPFRDPAAAARGLSEQGGTNGESSQAWKGWTNGEGDRVSTAAQFTRLTGPAVFSATSAPGAMALTTARAPTPVAPANLPPPVYPVPESTALAPVSAAIERMLLRQQDQLAVTVRFEQGGSLSLKLALRDGAITTHFQTDVAGLEEALRTGWASFAQDWNQRGVKLASPTFAGGTNTSADDAAGRHGQAFANPDEPGSAGASAGSFFNSGRRFGRGASRTPGAESVNPAPSGTDAPGLARRGFRTWA